MRHPLPRSASPGSRRPTAWRGRPSVSKSLTSRRARRYATRTSLSRRRPDGWAEWAELRFGPLHGRLPDGGCGPVSQSLLRCRASHRVNRAAVATHSTAGTVGRSRSEASPCHSCALTAHATGRSNRKRLSPVGQKRRDDRVAAPHTSRQQGMTSSAAVAQEPVGLRAEGLGTRQEHRDGRQEEAEKQAAGPGVALLRRVGRHGVRSCRWRRCRGWGRADGFGLRRGPRPPSGLDRPAGGGVACLHRSVEAVDEQRDVVLKGVSDGRRGVTAAGEEEQVPVQHAAARAEQPLQVRAAHRRRLVFDLAQGTGRPHVYAAVGTPGLGTRVAVSPVPHPGSGVVLGVLPRPNRTSLRHPRPGRLPYPDGLFAGHSHEVSQDAPTPGMGVTWFAAVGPCLRAPTCAVVEGAGRDTWPGRFAARAAEPRQSAGGP
ncbi:hypothetical protein GA0115239_10608 [Streptomyces sp. BpilaLS-43]|nr:hypothetical protein GA0115239_10608 [Streptomyces sp. BpilaLS-43]